MVYQFALGTFYSETAKIGVTSHYSLMQYFPVSRQKTVKSCKQFCISRSPWKYSAGLPHKFHRSSSQKYCKLVCIRDEIEHLSVSLSNTLQLCIDTALTLVRSCTREVCAIHIREAVV